MTINVAIYCRVSTDTQYERGYSIQEQEAICRKYGENNSYNILEVLHDDISGVTFDRPGMNKIIALAAAGKIKKVLVQELDRFTRDVSVLYILERQLSLHDVSVDYVLNNFQPGPIGDFHKTMTAAIAQLEREQIKARTRRGRQGKARVGKVVVGGKIKYGYDYREDSYYINEDEAKVVRLIFHWYTVEKLGISNIAKKLTEMQIPTKHDKQGYKKTRPYGSWSKGTIYDILQSIAYTGKLALNKYQLEKGKKKMVRPESEWIWVEIPAIISEEMFLAAQVQAVTNRTFSKRNTKREYLLAGTMTCATCGRSFVGVTSPNNPRYYRCGDQIAAQRGYGQEKQCHGYIRVQTIDELVWEKIVELLQNPELIFEAVANRKKESQQKEDVSQQRIQIVKSELQRISQEQHKLLDLYLNSSLPREILEERSVNLKTRQENFEQQLQTLEAQRQDVVIDEQTVKAAINYCEVMRKGLGLFTFEDRRKVIKALQVKILVYERRPLKFSLSGLLPTQELVFNSESGRPSKPKYYLFTLSF